MLQKQIEKEFIEAYKAKEVLKKNTLGILKSKITEWKASKGNANKEILDNDIISIIASEVKKRNQAIEIYKTNSSDIAIENAEKEEAELVILMQYLPKQMSTDEIIIEIDFIKAKLAEGARLMPVVMKHFNENFKGQFDNKKLQELLK